MISKTDRNTKQLRRTRSLRSDSGNERKKQRYSDGQNELVSTDGNGAPAMFLRKTYDMLATCDERLAAWDDNGETFVVKDPDGFAASVIPNYFEHSNFSSFARQLNFYGFKKIQMKPIRMDEGGRDRPKQVKFHNPNFQRGREELLTNILRSTRKNAAGISAKTAAQHGREIGNLKSKVSDLERQLARMEASFAIMRHQMREMMELQPPFPQYGEKSMPLEVQSSPNDVAAWPGSESNENVENAVATLDPSPHVKQMDPGMLPPPPPPIRSISLLRGFSNDFSKSESRLFADIMADSSS